MRAILAAILATITLSAAAQDAASLLMVIGEPSAPPSWEEGLVAFYPMNGNGDDAVGSFDMATVSGVFTNAGLSGEGFYNSSGVGLRYAAQIISGTNASVSLWVLCTGTTGRHFDTAPVAVGSVRTFNTDAVTFRYDLGGASPIQAAPAFTYVDIWTHIVITHSGNVLQIFTNGTLGDSHTSNKSPVWNSFITGSMNSVSGSATTYDEVRIWDRVLTTNEVQAVYEYDAP